MSNVMTLDEARKLLTRITYKHDATFDVENGVFGMVTLRVGIKAPCAEGSEVQCNYVYCQKTVWGIENMGERDLLETIKRTLVQVEMHEIDEWFRIDKKPFTEPHPDTYKDREYVTLPLKKTRKKEVNKMFTAT